MNKAYIKPQCVAVALNSDSVFLQDSDPNAKFTVGLPAFTKSDHNNTDEEDPEELGDMDQYW